MFYFPEESMPVYINLPIFRDTYTFYNILLPFQVFDLSPFLGVDTSEFLDYRMLTS